MFLALNLALTKKQRFGKLKTGEVKQINITNWTYYFYNNEINLKDFDAQLLKIDKKITKRLIFITSVMWLLKKLLIVIILTVQILCT